MQPQVESCSTPEELTNLYRQSALPKHQHTRKTSFNFGTKLTYQLNTTAHTHLQKCMSLLDMTLWCAALWTGSGIATTPRHCLRSWAVFLGRHSGLTATEGSPEEKSLEIQRNWDKSSLILPSYKDLDLQLLSQIVAFWYFILSTISDNTVSLSRLKGPLPHQYS